MSDIRHPGTVSALRPRPNRLLRRFLLLALLLVSVVAGLSALALHDRMLRAWAASLAVVGVLGSVIAWLAGASLRLSESDEATQTYSD